MSRSEYDANQHLAESAARGYRYLPSRWDHMVHSPKRPLWLRILMQLWRWC